MKTFYLTNKLRQELKKPFGIPILGIEEETDKKFKQFLEKRKIKKIITVGDCCSLTIPSDIKIFDGRMNRNEISPISPCLQPSPSPRSSCLNWTLRGFNPPGTINKNIWKTLKKAIKEKKNVYVEGEEDLLTIPCALLAKKGDIIVYGLPNKGICLIEISSETKNSIKKILKKFKKEKFKKIVLGGTFDRFHIGHKYFLSMAKCYANRAVIGLCSDKMVKKRKKGWKKIQPFKKRRETIEKYLKKIKFSAKIVEINDAYGPAIKDKNLQAILLTEETLENGRKINEIRKKNKLPELNYIVLPYVLDKKGRKISSGNIRKLKT